MTRSSTNRSFFPAPARPDDDLRLMFVELGLGDADGLLHVLIGQRRVDDLVAVVFQVGRLHAAWDRVPAVQEKDFHGAEPRSVTNRV